MPNVVRTPFVMTRSLTEKGTAVDGLARATAAGLALRQPGGVPRLVGGHRHVGVELRFQALDPLQVRIDHLHQRDLATADESRQGRSGQAQQL